MPEPRPATPPVVVAGGGWAGLAAAVTLCARGVPVLLLESARQTGGRARSIRLGDTVVDNGQHLVLGACTSLLELMQQVGVQPDEAFTRLPLLLQLHHGKKVSLKLRAPRLPAPFNLLLGMLTARGLSADEKFRALRFARRLPTLADATDRDISVQALLHSEGQSPGAIRKLWEPLCVAALNTPVELASAQLFIAVLRTTFHGPARHSDLLIPRRELSDLLPRPCATWLEQHGGRIELGQRVTALDIAARTVRGVYVGKRHIEARQVILATPHIITRRLLSRHPALEGLTDRLAGLGHEPVSTLYLQYPASTRLPRPMVGLEEAPGQWVFDRRGCGQPGLMAVVISARGDHAGLPATELARQVTAQLAACFPHWPAPGDHWLVREKRATFCARAGIGALRPGNDTVVDGLWLAGDYTATGLPATLEGAVRSGQRCAQAVIRSLTK